MSVIRKQKSILEIAMVLEPIISSPILISSQAMVNISFVILLTSSALHVVTIYSADYVSIQNLNIYQYNLNPSLLSQSESDAAIFMQDVFYREITNVNVSYSTATSDAIAFLFNDPNLSEQNFTNGSVRKVTFNNN
jgi:hypothetical protein